MYHYKLSKAQIHLCSTNADVCMLSLSLTRQLTSSPMGKKDVAIEQIMCMIWHGTAWTAPTLEQFTLRKSGGLVSDTYTYTHTKDECMHSNTTGFVVNALAAPHTIKVPIKGHYGFSTRGNRRESSSTACTMWVHRCLLCCHPKELRLIRKLYDHNYWSKFKCNSSPNSTG